MHVHSLAAEDERGGAKPDGNPCTADSCNSASGVMHDPLPAGTECGDANACNGVDTCDATGQCVHFDHVFSQDPCLVDVCDETTGWDLVPAEKGTICDSQQIPGVEACDGRGNCLPRDIAEDGSRPGPLRADRGRAPEHRRVGSRAFRAQAFIDEGETNDLVDYPGIVIDPTPTNLGARLSVVFTELSALTGAGPICEPRQEPYARIFIDGERTDIDVPPLTAADEPVVFTRTFLPSQTSVELALEVWERDNDLLCDATSGQLEFAWNAAIHDLTTPVTLPANCNGHALVDDLEVAHVCWHVEIEAIELPLAAVEPRLCFEWGTSFVDEAVGETVLGRPVLCMADEECASERCENGACTMEQRYPARFAEYQLALDGRSGSVRLGREYDAAGEPGLGTPRYLDGDGCIPEVLVPRELLAQAILPGDCALGCRAPLSITARVRTQLRKFDAGEQTGYDVRYSDFDLEDPSDDATYDVVEFQLGEPFNSDSGWQHVTGVSPDPSISALIPPGVIVFGSSTIVPGTNASAALGEMLARPDRMYPPRVFQVRLGDFREVLDDRALTCETVSTCDTQADCAGPALCQGFCDGGFAYCTDDGDCGTGAACEPPRRCSINLSATCTTVGELCEDPDDGTCITLELECRHCFADSQYSRATDTLFVGPAVIPVDAGSCQLRGECEPPQNCLRRDGAPCDGAPECFCSWPDQSYWKYVVAHEAGHQLQHHFVGNFSPIYEFGDAWDPPGVAPICGCSHVESSNQKHCLQSAEIFMASLNEGFGHFMATKSFNHRDQPGCGFGYYKEVLAPELIPSIPSSHCAAPGACTPWEPDPDFNIALPPVAVDCATPFRLRNTFCPSIPGQDASLLATEHDMLQFLQATHTQGARLDMVDLYAILRTSCDQRDPDCPGGICSEAPCADVNSPFSCGRRCLSESDGIADVLRWAPLTADDPGGPATVSLLDGAERYLTQKFGVNSEEFEEFEEKGLQHGITPNLSP